MQSLIRADDPRQIKEVVNNIVRQFDNYGSVTLTNGSATTVVINPKVNPLSVIFLQATNEAARATTTSVSAKGDGQFTITHASAETARTFDYVIFGV
ncbi:hypothetical protein D9M69_544340 [compost metagenome]